MIKIKSIRNFWISTFIVLSVYHNCSCQEISQEPVFSQNGGLYSETRIVEIYAPLNAKIYYTTDGKQPDTSSHLYKSPLVIERTTVLRAAVFELGKYQSNTVTQTYFINEKVNLPIVSIVTNPDNLFSDRTGIYVTGTNGCPNFCDLTPRNLNQDWERPANVELYENDGKQAFNQVAGIKIHGNCSRSRFPQKSLAVFSRKEYGKDHFKYQLFPAKKINKFHSFLLRSSSDDQPFALMRDALAQGLLEGTMNVETQAYNPVVLFINGQYWGIHEIREKINKHYFSGNFHISTENVNIFEQNVDILSGNAHDYILFIDSLKDKTISDNYYEYIKTLIDIDSYIDYLVAHIYLGEKDWPGANIKVWKANSGKFNKWRWLCYDMDQCFLDYTEDVLNTATSVQGAPWPNPAWSTLQFRKLLENDKFKNQFIQVFAFHMSTTFTPERIIHFVDSFKAILAPEVPRHIEKWGGKKDPDFHENWPIHPAVESFQNWERYIDTIKIFAVERPAYALKYIQTYFKSNEMSELIIEADRKASDVEIYNKILPESEWKCRFFSNIPIKIKAKTKPGFRFLYWEWSSSGKKTKKYNSPEIEIIPENDSRLKAIFISDNKMNLKSTLAINCILE